VTSCPNPLYGDNGSGIHNAFALSERGTPLSAGNGYAGAATWACMPRRLLKHSAALSAFANPNPTTNTTLRSKCSRAADPLAYSRRQSRGGESRIPSTNPNPTIRRIEYRGPIAQPNPYLLFSATDGGARRHQGKIAGPSTRRISTTSARIARHVAYRPAFAQPLDALRADHDFLLRATSSTSDVIDNLDW